MNLLMGPLYRQFHSTSSTIVSDHKTKFWLMGLDSPFDWISFCWFNIQHGVIRPYLGIPFGVAFSPSFISSITRAFHLQETLLLLAISLRKIMFIMCAISLPKGIDLKNLSIF